ncbi:hypothetical protein LDENG_00068320 [Lucifuga dentata]|nr:hypothetical protein LDENG_00068320 [Lucifuga dentata]
MHNRWSTEETAAHVALALKGKALQVLLDLTSAEQRHYPTLAAALQCHFGQRITTDGMRKRLTHHCRREGETLDAYAADIRFYAQRSYPTFTPDAREELALCAFIQGLTSERLKEHLCITAPKIFSAALEEAERVEPVLTAKCSQRPRIGRLGHAHGLYVICSLDGNPCQALVDTGATNSIVHPGVLPETNSWWPAGWACTTCKIRTVTGGQARMRGKHLLQVKVGGVEVTHEFWLADIQDPCIIGLDLLQRWGAQVNGLRKVIHLGTETVALHCHQEEGLKHLQGQEEVPEPTSPVTTNTIRSTNGSLATYHADYYPACGLQAVHDLWRHSSEGLDPQQSQQLWDLLHDFTNIFAALDEECTQTGLVQHSIDTGAATPIKLSPHQLPFAERRAAEQIIQEMATAGIIEPSNSPWAAPVVLVKKDGGWQFCVDYRRLNAVTRKDSYPLPRIDDALDYITGSRWFSSLDLWSGYWQVELVLEAKSKTIFTIGQGLWQFHVMPFGLCNAPATFERLMERVLAQIPKSHCLVYLDDLLVHATDFEGVLENLRQVFEAIQGAGLCLSPKKCSLLRWEDKFLGHFVGAEGVAKDPAKVEAVKDWPVPQSVNELHSFLGLASYYRRFVHNFATIASPLHRLTDKGQGFSWDDSCAATFTQLCDALTNAPVLAFPDPRHRFIVDTDASNRELLAVVSALHHFRPYLYGQSFLLRTDHASLTWLLSFKEPESQVARWIEALQSYSFDVQHRAGRLHSNADALSRRPCVSVDCRHCRCQEEGDQTTLQVAAAQRDKVVLELLPAVTNQEWWAVQDIDPILSRVGQWVDAGRRLSWQDVSALAVETKAIFHSGPPWLSVMDCCTGCGLPQTGGKVWQLLVPKVLRQWVLQAVHGSVGAGHFGVTKT